QSPLAPGKEAGEGLGIRALCADFLVAHASRQRTIGSARRADIIRVPSPGTTLQRLQRRHPSDAPVGESLTSLSRPRIRLIRGSLPAIQQSTPHPPLPTSPTWADSPAPSGRAGSLNST